MTKKERLIISLVFLLLLSSLSSGIQSADGLQIIGPENIYFKRGMTARFYFIVYNSSNNAVTNATTECSIAFYNETGDREGGGSCLYNTTLDEFYYNTPLTLTATSGTVPYIVSCNDSIEAGYSSGTFEVAESKFDTSLGGAPLAVIILLPMLLVIVLLGGSISLSEEHDILRIGLFLFSFIPFFISLHFATLVLVNAYGFESLQDIIGSITYWIILFVTVVIIYFIIYFIIKAFRSVAEQREEKLNY